MLKEYLARVDLENSEELDKLQIQMKGLLDELNVKQELIDKLRREKNLDINIFSPRSMDAEADEKIEKAMQEKLEINQSIEYVRGLIETYTKKKMEYEELRKELMESEIDAKTDSGEDDGKVEDEEIKNTEVTEKIVKETEIETEDSGTDNQKIEDGNNDNVGTGITDINKPEINTEILPDGKSVTLSNKNNLQNVRDKVSSAIDKNMRLAAHQTEHSEQSDNEMADCEAPEHDKMSEKNKMPGHDKMSEYNEMPGHDKMSEQNGTPELNGISEYDEPGKNPIDRMELLDFLDAIYRQTELCMAITSNRNQCKAELRSLKSKIKNYAAKIEVQD